MSEKEMELLIDSVQSVRGLEGEQITRIGIWWLCEKGVGNLLIEQKIIGGEPFYRIDNELMSRDFIKRVLCTIVDKAKLESENGDE